MAKYRVVLMGVADASEGGIKVFMSRFAAAYKMTPEQAKAWIQKSRGVIYTCEDLAAAEKGKDYLTRLGAVAEIKEDAPAPPPAVTQPPLAAAPSPPDPAPARATAECEVPSVPEFEENPAPADSADLGPPDFDPTTPPRGAGYVNANPEKQARTRHCPKCLRLVPAAQDLCPYCQVYISKYEQMLARRAQAGAETEAAEPPGGIASAAEADSGIYAPDASARPGASRYNAVATAIATGTAVKCPEASMALMCSLVGLFCAGLIGPAAIYYGFKALGIINRDPRFTGKGQAMAGTIIGIVETLFFLTAISSMIVMFSRGMEGWIFR
jgi:hypothetical protein